MKKSIPYALLVILSVLALVACGDESGGSPGSPPPAPVARTGQSTSYDSNTDQADDGALQKGVVWPSPRFTDNGDGTISDGLTGLVWLQDANCIATHDASVLPGNEFDNDGTTGDGMVLWQHALDFVAGINTGPYADCGAGKTDWRLPNYNELLSLVDYGKSPSLPSNNYLTHLPVTLMYWSSTSSDGIDAMSVNFSDDGLASGKIIASDVNYVLAVRGTSTPPAPVPMTGQTTSYAAGDDSTLQKGVAWPSLRFTDNGNGTIRDRLTGLIWLKDANCIATHDAASPGSAFDNDGVAGDGLVTWQHALDFVAGINDGTYADCGAGRPGWRLPNARELMSLRNMEEANLSSWLGSMGFDNVLASSYWSSTSAPGTPVADAIEVTFEFNAEQGRSGKGSFLAVLPVHDT